MRRTVHVVLGGGMVLAAYTRPYLASRHAQCLTGATAVECELVGELPPVRMGSVTIYVAMGGGVVLVVSADVETAYARCVEGAEVWPCELLEQLPEAIAVDIEIEEWSEDNDTPVVSVDDVDDASADT
jgi:hypothetical protein